MKSIEESGHALSPNVYEVPKCWAKDTGVPGLSQEAAKYLGNSTPFYSGFDYSKVEENILISLLNNPIIPSPAITKGLSPAYPGFMKPSNFKMEKGSWCQLCEEHAGGHMYKGFFLCSTCLALMKGEL